MTWCPPQTSTSSDGWASTRDVPRDCDTPRHRGYWWDVLAAAGLHDSRNLPGIVRALVLEQASGAVEAALRLGEPWLVVHSRLAVDVLVPSMGWCVRLFRCKPGRDCLRVGQAVADGSKVLGHSAVWVNA